MLIKQGVNRGEMSIFLHKNSIINCTEGVDSCFSFCEKKKKLYWGMETLSVQTIFFFIFLKNL